MKVLFSIKKAEPKLCFYIKYDIPYSMILQFLMSECVANGVSCYYTHARKVDHADLERLDALFNKPVDVEE